MEQRARAEGLDHARSDRDVFQRSGVSHLLILLGINDLGIGAVITTEDVSADQVTAGLSSLISQAKSRGPKVIVGTLLPYEGAFYFTRGGVEAPRHQRVDSRQPHCRWRDRLRRGAAGPVPSKLRAAYESGDALHPNDAGYAAMANAVDLAALR